LAHYGLRYRLAAGAFHDGVALLVHVFCLARNSVPFLDSE
jgi:hypothetical protein